MKIIHTSDWHLGKILNDYSLLEDQRFWLDSFLHKLIQIKPDVVVIAGDIYDRSVPSAEAVSLLNETLNRMIRFLHCAIIITAGNHDSKERLCFGSELLEQSGLFLVGKTSFPPKKITLSDQYGPVNFYPHPYSNHYDIKAAIPDSDVSSLQDAVTELCQPMLQELDLSQRNVLIAHGFFTSVPPNLLPDDQKVGADSMVSLLPFQDFDYIALGHIHMQKNAGLQQAYYSGSPLKYSVDEADQKKGFLEIDFQEKGSVQITPHTVSPLRDLKIIEGSFQAVSALRGEQDQPDDDYVFFYLTDPIPVIDAVAKLKAFFPHILGLKFIQLSPELSQSKTTLETIREKDTKTLFSDFYQSTTGQPLTPYQADLSDSILKTLEEQKR